MSEPLRPTLPAKNETYGFLGTWLLNQDLDDKRYRKPANVAWQMITDLLNEDWDFGPEAIRRILDSKAGRALADQLSYCDQFDDLRDVFTRWMRGRLFKKNILEMASMTDEDFYGE